MIIISIMCLVGLFLIVAGAGFNITDVSTGIRVAFGIIGALLILVGGVLYKKFYD